MFYYDYIGCFVHNDNKQLVQYECWTLLAMVLSTCVCV